MRGFLIWLEKALTWSELYEKVGRTFSAIP
jgi:hypothetical protein